MGRSTREHLAERREAVEHALLELPWTVRTQTALGKDWGVKPREIRADALVIRRRWAEEAKKTGAEAGRADWLHRLRAAQGHAMSQNQSIALSRLMHLEARACGYEAAVNVNVNHTVEHLDPASQARAIVDSYEQARQYLTALGEPKMIIDAECEVVNELDRD